MDSDGGEEKGEDEKQKGMREKKWFDLNQVDKSKDWARTSIEEAAEK